MKKRVLVYGALLFAIVSILLLAHFRTRPTLFIISEIALIGFAVFGYRLVLQVFGPLRLLTETTRLLGEQDFTTRLRPVGHPEMDRLIGIYNDMSKILWEQRVRNQEQEFFLRKVLQSTSVAIVSFDFDGFIDQVNPAAARFFQKEADTLVGKSLEQIDSPLATALAKIPTGEDAVVPLRGQRRLKVSHAQFLDRGFYKGYMFLAEVTEELRRTEKGAYQKLVRVISHEINNSLGATHSLLRSCLQYADQIGTEDREDYTTALKVAISRTEHLQTFVSDYVSVVKLPQPNRVPTHLGELLDHVHHLLSAEFEKRRIQWRDVGEPEGKIPMDRLQMEQVFLNIIKNAMEAIGEDGVITVRSGNHKERPHLIIEDTGPGIPPEIEDQLFIPFYTTKAGGQGIGLTMAAEVLNNHGFDYALESAAGESTRFTIWF